ncbi:glycine hydroxymethyltransferase [Nitrosomonas communis]|uniref:Glycine hydroxymethyltransferase n=1 Tax=Nitrosomonas communis TaxID=44574 RepID=A0A1I4NF15_9PROT|nr:glycine hydroxymethyltransferase [Nitrosomonas communis]SFM13803.1 hypothetical protein SAMN05421863_101471 [Nitrosomonas communis]
MKVFNPRHFLRHISMPTLREFTEAHVLNANLDIDWEQPADTLPTALADAIDALHASLPHLLSEERGIVEYHIGLWYDDLQRAHKMSHELAIKEFQLACQGDALVEQAFATRDDRETALWMLAFRDKIFRDTELHLAFQAKANGKYWKKHRIQPGLSLSRDREKLEAFCQEVAKLYKKVGAGKSTHIELSQRAMDGSIQLTIYVEGPVTAMAQFADNQFKRITTRIALETALVYHPGSGIVETVVKGGAKNHTAVLELFGKHVVENPITPEAIEKKRYKLNALLDGLMQPFEDWSRYGVEKVRLRRARFCPVGMAGVSYQVEADSSKEHADAVRLALQTFKTNQAFEAEYHLDGASIIVYITTTTANKPQHFSFDLYSSGSSTIKNLSARNQPIANAVLRALNVIEMEEQIDEVQTR